jgi:hypothetical protein
VKFQNGDREYLAGAIKVRFDKRNFWKWLASWTGFVMQEFQERAGYETSIDVGGGEITYHATRLRTTGEAYAEAYPGSDHVHIHFNRKD